MFPTVQKVSVVVLSDYASTFTKEDLEANEEVFCAEIETEASVFSETFRTDFCQLIRLRRNNVKRQSIRYVLLGDVLYKRSFDGVLLRCLDRKEAEEQ